MKRALDLDHIERVANVLRAMAEARLARGEVDDAAAAASEALGVADMVSESGIVKEFGILVRELLRVIDAGIALARGDTQLAQRLAATARRRFVDANAPLCVAEADAVLDRITTSVD